uniref:Dirigent protein n=1 Tax=Haemonchus contortus TaxID=6289 RepID=A0A7I4Y7T8_HAECO
MGLSNHIDYGPMATSGLVSPVAMGAFTVTQSFPPFPSTLKQGLDETNAVLNATHRYDSTISQQLNNGHNTEVKILGNPLHFKACSRSFLVVFAQLEVSTPESPASDEVT